MTKTASSPQTQLPAVLNRKSHHARLSLARAYNRTEEGAKDAETYYNEVMVMSPEVSVESNFAYSVGRPKCIV